MSGNVSTSTPNAERPEALAYPIPRHARHATRTKRVGQGEAISPLASMHCRPDASRPSDPPSSRCLDSSSSSVACRPAPGRTSTDTSLSGHVLYFGLFCSTTTAQHLRVAFPTRVTPHTHARRQVQDHECSHRNDSGASRPLPACRASLSSLGSMRLT